MNLMDKEYRPWHGGYYMVSQDGYIYVTQSGKGWLEGHFLLPFWQNGICTYNVRIDGKPKQLAASTATLETWGHRIKTTEELTIEMRANVAARHGCFLPQVNKSKNEKISKSLKDKNNEIKDSMPCPWSTPGKLGAGPEGVSWYSAQCDPMTRGVWLEGNVETVKARRKAA